jgi:hypothetical protein
MRSRTERIGCARIRGEGLRGGHKLRFADAEKAREANLQRRIDLTKKRGHMPRDSSGCCLILQTMGKLMRRQPDAIAAFTVAKTRAALIAITAKPPSRASGACFSLRHGRPTSQSPFEEPSRDAPSMRIASRKLKTPQ